MKQIIALIAVFFLISLASVIAQDKPLYGYTDQYFYVYNSLTTVVSNEVPELITDITEGKPMQMTLEGDVWYFYTKKKLSSTEKYCIKVGREYIPYVFMSEWPHVAKKHMDMINLNDVLDNGIGGFDFKTAKQ